MADIKTIKTIEVNGVKFQVKPCWEQLGLTQEYMIALLSRDEYTPVATKQPTSTDVMYTDPVSGNPAGFHSGQCVIYPDSSASDGWGLSIAKYVVYGSDGIPTSVAWYHATDVEKRVAALEENITIIHKGCLGTGVWINDYPWQADAVWDNGE